MIKFSIFIQLLKRVGFWVFLLLIEGTRIILYFISQNSHGNFLCMNLKYQHFVHKFICTGTLKKGTRASTIVSSVNFGSSFLDYVLSQRSLCIYTPPTAPWLLTQTFIQNIQRKILGSFQPWLEESLFKAVWRKKQTGIKFSKVTQYLNLLWGRGINQHGLATA